MVSLMSIMIMTITMIIMITIEFMMNYMLIILSGFI